MTARRPAAGEGPQTAEAPLETAGPARAGLLPIEQMQARLEQALRRSPADETELVWIEVRRRTAASRGQPPGRPWRERTVQARIIEKGRLGTFRTDRGEPSDLDGAIRQALAQSSVHPPLPGLPHLPADPTPTPDLPGLYDTGLATLEGEAARELLAELSEGRALVTLEWAEAHVLVFNSRGLRRTAAVTAALLDARVGRGPGAGRAVSAGRSLDQLRPPAVMERALARHARGEAGDLPPDPLPVVLSPEASARLCQLLNRVAFSALAYHEGTSFLREHLGVQVFDRTLNLRDDATDPAGLPFPFDLEGTAKHAVDLIVAGSPRTPGLDQRQAAQLGLPPTGHSIGGNDARAENLFLVPGDLSEDALLQAAEGGVWVSDLGALECFDPRRVMVRARLVGARRIRPGGLAEALPDLIWEDSLLRALSNLVGIGDRPVVLTSAGGVFGAASSPALGLSEVAGLRLAPE